MAQTRSGGSGKSRSSKNTGKKNTAASRSRASASGRSGSKKQASSRARRRAQSNNLVASVVLAALGLLCVALVLVPGAAFWHTLRGWMFGVFGIITYLLGPFLLYLAYLLAAGYKVEMFAAKTVLMATLIASVPVVFSRVTLGEGSTVWDVVKMLFNRGQQNFWEGGVLGAPVGAALLALCGRPGANIIMLLILAAGLMVFFALTPADVVQFVSYYWQQAKDAREARLEEERAYDTQLFQAGPDEEPLENLTGALPVQQHPVYDVEKEIPRTAPAAAPAAPVPPRRSSGFAYDVDLGPTAGEKALQEAVQNDPLQPVVIGPGGTFGLDPLKNLAAPTEQVYTAPPQEEF